MYLKKISSLFSKAVCTWHASGAVRLSIVYKYRSFLNPESVSLLRQYRNRLCSNVDYNRRIRKIHDIAKSDPCVRQKNAQDAAKCI